MLPWCYHFIFFYDVLPWCIAVIATIHCASPCKSWLQSKSKIFKTLIPKWPAIPNPNFCDSVHPGKRSFSLSLSPLPLASDKLKSKEYACFCGGIRFGGFEVKWRFLSFQCCSDSDLDVSIFGNNMLNFSWTFFVISFERIEQFSIFQAYNYCS